MKVSDGIFNIGVNDREIDLFEGMYTVPEGMAYNSYLITDEKIAILDSVDGRFCSEWLLNAESALCGRTPDYIVVLHMEPDHSANIVEFCRRYPNVKIVGNGKTFVMLGEYFDEDFSDRKIEVKDGDTLSLGSHSLKFIFAPLVHWPEVMVAYDAFSGTLFSADAFGKFGALDSTEKWEDEARRYYYGIVGKFGVQVQNLLKKVSALDIKRICSLHGPVLNENIDYYIGKYSEWSAYKPEVDGVFIVYSSIYGHTKKAAERLFEMLKDRGCTASICDIARSDRARCVGEAFMFSKLVIATTTYNNGIFPAMREFIDCLTERNFQGRKIGIIENGTWAPTAAKCVKERFASCKNVVFTENTVTVRASLDGHSAGSLAALAEELTR